MEKREDIKQTAKKFGVDPYIIRRFDRLWGSEKTNEILGSSETKPPTCIRSNTLKTDPEKLYESLTSQGFSLLEVKDCKIAFTVDYAPFPLSHTVEYLNGEFFIQTQASVYPPIVLNPKPYTYVLDLAAAPGGKTSHLAQIMEDTGVIVAVEVHRDRITGLVHNLFRLGVSNVLVIRFDARTFRTTRQKFDYILVDAPCSGEGLLAVDFKRRTNKTVTDIRNCSLLQAQILEKAASLLAPGGTLVYSTCSYAPEENEQQIDFLIRRYPHMYIVPTGLKIGEPGLTCAFGNNYAADLKMTRRLFPHTDNTIGFFIAKIRSRKN
ncbi:MAG: RsmB/NOP family class I SAM-dependent RNA methyltransferase [Candidatus Ranarchaeia archaeon]